MEYKYLEIHTLENNGIEVRLNRPEVHNAFNEDFISELSVFFKTITNDLKLRFVLLSASGSSFCAGADLNWMKKMKTHSKEENQADSEKLYDLFLTMSELPIPLLGLVQGNAFGGGIGLISVCDFVLARDNVHFALTEVRIGLAPAVISTFVMKKIGYSAMLALSLSGERFDSPTAMKLGLIHGMVSESNWDDQIKKLIKSFLQAGPLAARRTKKIIKEVQKMPAEQIKKFVCQEIAQIRVSAEAQSGMTALLEKSKMPWSVG